MYKYYINYFSTAIKREQFGKFGAEYFYMKMENIGGNMKKNIKRNHANRVCNQQEMRSILEKNLNPL